MLRISIDIVPFGVEPSKRRLSTIEIANVHTHPNNTADYKFFVVDVDSGMSYSGKLRGHKREEGYMILVDKVIKKYIKLLEKKS